MTNLGRNLLIAETNADGTFKTLLKENVPVKLGEAGIINGIISETSFQHCSSENNSIFSLKRYYRLAILKKLLPAPITIWSW